MVDVLEGPATGSANATLAALRLHLSNTDRLVVQAVQGAETRLESRLSLSAWCAHHRIRASVCGTCVDMFRGTAPL